MDQKDDLNTKQPNVPASQPNVSNNAAGRLPPETKGQIHQICQEDQTIEAKRRIRHKEVMKLNTFAYKNGRYSKNFPVPQYLVDYLGFIDELDFSNPEEVGELMKKMIKDNYKRIVIEQHLELEKGSGINPVLMRLTKDTFMMLQYLRNPALLSTQSDHIEDSSNIITQLNEYERQSALTIIREALARAGAENQK